MKQVQKCKVSAGYACWGVKVVKKGGVFGKDEPSKILEGDTLSSVALCSSFHHRGTTNENSLD